MCTCKLLRCIACTGGVALQGDAKARFNEIQQELSKLSTKFSNNVLDATKAFKKVGILSTQNAGILFESGYRLLTSQMLQRAVAGRIAIALQ